MAIKFFPISDLHKFLNILTLQGILHAPVLGMDGVLRYSELTPGIVPDLYSLRPKFTAKKYLFPPYQTVMTYNDAKGYQLPVEDLKPLILLGLHPCDLAAISYFDKFFLGDFFIRDTPDPLYAARRSSITLIGVSCISDEFCSCYISPSPLQPFSDLFLQSFDNGFAVTSGSSRGDELLENLKEILIERDIVMADDTRSFFGQSSSKVAVKEIDETDPEWQELADHCLGCGACSICCPTCACFDILEFGRLDGTSAIRIRQWDNCLFKSHSQVAGGISFNKNRAERFRYRYRHKYRGFGPLKGIPSCVGCGRCRVVCPAKIDLRPLAKRLEG